MDPSATVAPEPVPASGCGATKACATEGRCWLNSVGECIAESAAACAASSACAKYARCGLGTDGACKVLDPSLCPKTEGCTKEGKCGYFAGRCQPTKTEHCAKDLPKSVLSDLTYGHDSTSPDPPTKLTCEDVPVFIDWASGECSAMPVPALCNDMAELTQIYPEILDKHGQATCKFDPKLSNLLGFVFLWPDMWLAQPSGGARSTERSWCYFLVGMDKSWLFTPLLSDRVCVTASEAACVRKFGRTIRQLHDFEMIIACVETRIMFSYSGCLRPLACWK